MLTFIPLGSAFAVITAVGICFILPKKRDVERRICTLYLDKVYINATREFEGLRGKDLLMVRAGEQEVKA